MIIDFEKNLKTFSSTFSILVFSAIIFFLSACVVTAGRDPYYLQDAAERRGDLGSIEGLWYITAANYFGKLELHWERRMWVGRIWFDVFQQWEPLTDIIFDPRTGELQFTRPNYASRYVGTLWGDQLRGTFVYAGQTLPWEARKESTRLGPLDFQGIEGLWYITAANYSGKLEFHWERHMHMWVGRVWFDVFQQWEPLTDIIFDRRTGELQFTRPNYASRYVGALSGDQLAGTLVYQGMTYSWGARRR